MAREELDLGEQDHVPFLLSVCLMLETRNCICIVFYKNYFLMSGVSPKNLYT